MLFKSVNILIVSDDKRAKNFFPYHDFDKQAQESLDKLFLQENLTEQKIPGDHYFFLNPLLATTINVSDVVVFDEVKNPNNDLVGSKFYPAWLLKDKEYLDIYEQWFDFVNKGDLTEIGIIKKEIDLSNASIQYYGVYLNHFTKYVK